MVKEPIEEVKKEEGTKTPEPVLPLKEETIVVKKSALNKILEKLDMLEEVADKSRLGFWQDKHKQPGLKIVLLSTYEGKTVLGWEKVIDEVFQDMGGIWHEKQIVRLHLEDGKDVDVNYIDSVRKIQKIEAEVLSTSKDEVIGSESLKVKTKDGREYTVDVRFVN